MATGMKNLTKWFGAGEFISSILGICKEELDKKSWTFHMYVF